MTLSCQTSKHTKKTSFQDVSGLGSTLFFWHEDKQRGQLLDFNTTLIMHGTINTGLARATKHSLRPTRSKLFLPGHGFDSSHRNDIMLLLRAGGLPLQLRWLQHYHPVDLGIASILFQRGCSLSPSHIALQSLRADPPPSPCPSICLSALYDLIIP